MKIKNLSQLKKYIKPGIKMTLINHYLRNNKLLNIEREVSITRSCSFALKTKDESGYYYDSWFTYGNASGFEFTPIGFKVFNIDKNQNRVFSLEYKLKDLDVVKGIDEVISNV